MENETAAQKAETCAAAPAQGKASLDDGFIWLDSNWDSLIGFYGHHKWVSLTQNLMDG